jgi:hypothetical protein
LLETIGGIAKLFETTEFTVSTGQKILCAISGSVLVSIAKVSIYAMGKVSGYSKQELSELQAFKQSNRKLFDSDSNNEKRLLEIKKLKHNYERSRAMLNSILLAGFDESSETVNIIIEHLLEVGQAINKTNCENHKSEIVSPNGVLLVISRWKILSDGERYLTTINFNPIL